MATVPHSRPRAPLQTWASVRLVADLLPAGRALPSGIWTRRHRAVVRLLWLHVLGAGLFALVMGMAPEHAALDAALVAGFAVIASAGRLSRTVRSVAASLGLLMASAVLVHIAAGLAEMHFHFFVMVGVIALYQNWTPFLFGVGFVMVHHAVAGTIAPTSVFDHPTTGGEPLMWAAIHGGFLLAASLVSLTAWRFVEHQALHDPLTGLANRTLFAERVDRAMAMSARSGTAVVVLFMDLDEFKAINDSLGHDAGDTILRVAAQRLEASVGTGHTVARYGGDEFAVLLADLPAVEASIPIIERLRAALGAPIQVHDRTVVIRASIGVAVGSNPGSADDVVRQADLAMYLAKHRGGDDFEIFDPAVAEARLDESRRREEVRAAVAERAFSAAFQPIVDLATGRPTGAEVLARWHHPHRGPVSPAAFIPMAEATGDIVELGIQMLDAGCAALAAWRTAGVVDDDFQIGVNLSACHVMDPDLLEHLEDALRRHGLSGRDLILEITEGVLLGDSDFVIEQLRGVKSIGVGLALDDFGTGFSALSYLRRFPIDILKIDRSFVAEIGSAISTTRDQTVLIQTILTMSANLGLECVAEGIERPDQLAVLRDLGCRSGQGFLFARALDRTAFEAYLEADAASRETPSAA